MGRIGDPSAVNALIDVASRDGSLDVKIEALKALRDLGYAKISELTVSVISQAFRIPRDIAEKFLKDRGIEFVLEKGKVLEKFFKFIRF